MKPKRIKRNRQRRIDRFKKFLAMFLLVNFLQSIILPTVASALTSGPTAPEATSFEPVDTTDMVNLQTGDFTYNMPLLEVPGPEGGYPLSLAYHAGIKPLEEASWVGLGWSLNPGAINRSVNGFPDDFKEVTRTIEDQWEGGKSHSFSAGIGIGKSSAIKANLGLTVSHDTYQGYNGSVSIGISAPIMNAPIGSRFRGGLSIGTEGNVAMSTGVSINSISVGAGHNSLSVGYNSGHGSVLGISMSSGSGISSLSSAVGSIHMNNNNSRLSTSGFTIDPSIFITAITKLPISASYSYTRYWIDEKDDVDVYGALYAKDADNKWTSANQNYSSNLSPSANNSIDGPEGYSFDAQTYARPKANQVENYASMPAYDRYQVLGQGIGGSFSPKIFEPKTLFRQKVVNKNDNGDVAQILKNHILPSNGKFTKDVNFHFDYDFSNSHQVTQSQDFGASNVQNISFIDGNTLAGENIANYDGFNSASQHLAGSKHLDWYTNQAIGSNSLNFVGFPKSLSLNTKRLQNDYKDQIGGFSVTKADGLTYHYGLPAYSFDEYEEHIRIIDANNGTTTNHYNKEHRGTPYAYTWFLTGITGPDFVDRGSPGQFDDADWGYWVSFDYGLWTDEYEWRTPYEGYTIDINNRNKSFAYGKKEIYYLDAIKTRTHTALFVKDIRYDAKSIVGQSGGIKTEQEALGFCRTSAVDIPLNVVTKVPKSQLKLSSILVMDNDKLTQLTGSNTLSLLKDNFNAPYDDITYQESDVSSVPINLPPGLSCNSFFYTVSFPHQIKYHNSDNVLTTDDLAGLSLPENSLKSVWFDTDYSLCPETANSFDHANLYQQGASIPNARLGKLTLNSVAVKGVGNTSIVPPTNFYYDEESPDQAGFSFDPVAEKITITSNQSKFEAGDIVKFNTLDVYGLLLKHTGSNQYDFEFIGENEYNSALTSTLSKTNNPPFNKEKYDYWGYYKPDYDDSQHLAPTSTKRAPSNTVKNTTVWSLKMVEGTTGSKIKVNYEPKEYENIVVDNGMKFHIRQITGHLSNNPYSDSSPSDLTVWFHEDVKTADYFSVGDIINVCIPACYYNSNPFTGYQHQGTFVEKSSAIVKSVYGNNALRIENFNLTPLIDNNTFEYFKFDQSGFIEVLTPNSGIKKGGGIRVSSIELLSGNANTNKETIYTYNQGTISYAPYGSGMMLPDDGQDEITSANINLYIDKYTEDWDPLSNLMGLMPSPAIMYENVETTQKANGLLIPGKTKYYFKVFNQDMLKYEVIDDPTINNSSAGSFLNYQHTDFIIKDKTAQIGSLMKVESYNGEDQVVGSTTYNYVDDGDNGESENDYDQYNKQGIIEQSFSEFRRESPIGTYGLSAGWNDYLRSSVTTHKKYPAILASTTTVANGITTTTYNHSFDFYTGNPTVVETENSYGEHFLTTSTPAYEKYPSMGLKVNTPDNKHMLNQNAATQLEKLDQSGNSIGVVSASVTTWKGNWAHSQYVDNNNGGEDVWRKHKSFTYLANRNDVDGTFASTVTPFNWTPDATQHTNWQQTSEITLYDHYSKPLEVKDINGDYAATKMGYDESKVLATIANAKYREFAHATAEPGTYTGNIFDGGITVTTGSPVNVNGTTGQYRAHSGTHALLTDGEGFVFSTRLLVDVDPSRTYRASVWVGDNGNNTVELGIRFLNGSAPDQVVTLASSDIQAGTWKLLTMDIDIPSNATGQIEIFTDAKGTLTFFDDFRFHPIDAPMTSYVYDEVTGQLRFILDAENFFTEYEYKDDRLHKVFRESTEVEGGRRIISKHEINYKN